MNDTPTISFNGTDYTQAGLSSMSMEDLLALRNLVAENLGVARIKSFKDQAQAVDATWKALDKWNSQDEPAGAETGAQKTKAAAKPKEPKAPAEPAKCGKPAKVTRPTRRMFSKIQKIAEHPGKGFRIRRWENYKDGMTLLDCAEGDDMTPLDVGFYVDNKLMKLIEPTDEEFEAGLAAWYKKHGLENPAEVKAKKEAERKAAAEAKAKEREEAKQKKEAEKAAKAKEREEAKQKKAAEAEAKKEAAKVAAE